MSFNSIYSEIQQAINDGSVFSLPRARIEQYIAALSRSQAFSHFGASGFPRICETIRLALSIKVSEDANLQAKRESRIALWVSFTALLVGIVSAFAALWPIIFPSAIQVYSTKSKPVYVAEPLLTEGPENPVSATVLSNPLPQKAIIPTPASVKGKNHVSTEPKSGDSAKLPLK